MSGAAAAAAEVNYLDMSDEELLKLAPPEDTPSIEAAPAASREVVEPKGDPDAGAGSHTDPGAADPAGQVADPNAGNPLAAGDDDEGAAAKQPSAPESAEPASPAPKEPVAGAAAPEGGEVKPPVEPVAPAEPVAIDYKAEYEKLIAPFRANGRDMQVRDIDDARTLMQMGANYNKKMAAMKPHLKVLKVLENNGLLDEGKISFLIDLSKNNPGAIQKLVKDSGIDPMELDADKAGEYKQTTYTVDDRELALNAVLDELEGSPAYNRTLDIVGNKWDGASKQVIADTPEILRIIHNHVETGMYDLIVEEMERERMFGRLNGMSDIHAYKQVGDAINARGGFDHLVQKAPAAAAPAAAQPAAGTQGQPNTQPVVVTPKPKEPVDDPLNDKRRAASSTKPAVNPAVPASDFNPLALSDEEFARQVRPQFL